VASTLDAAGRTRDYRIEGQLFFASAEEFLAAFDLSEALEKVRIDLTHAHIWDLTGVNAIDRIVLKFRRAGVAVEVIGLNQASATIMDKFAMHDRPDAMEKVLGH
jgi:SulP family sulfate permease